MKLNSFPHYLQLDAMDCGPSWPSHDCEVLW